MIFFLQEAAFSPVSQGLQFLLSTVRPWIWVSINDMRPMQCLTQKSTSTASLAKTYDIISVTYLTNGASRCWPSSYLTTTFWGRSSLQTLPSIDRESLIPKYFFLSSLWYVVCRVGLYRDSNACLLNFISPCLHQFVCPCCAKTELLLLRQ